MKDNELIDCGDGQRLERFGNYTISRPDPKALWKKHNPHLWKIADASYQKQGEHGRWIYKKQPPKPWLFTWNNLKASLKPTSFKHVGVFPEQESQWELIQKLSAQTSQFKALNLFAYTGMSTLAALSAGAQVTHVDSSKEALTWARENAQLSNLADKPVRWIPEDAMTFVKREIKRGGTYNAVILDPPKFGRGDRREVWKIERDLPKLLDAIKQILRDPQLVIINTYNTDWSSIVLANMLDDLNLGGMIKHGELTLTSRTGRVLPTSIFASIVL